MRIVYQRCCGLDVHQKSVTACLLLIDEHGEYTVEKGRFGTMTRDLRRLADWLHAQGVRRVAMEATGVYWKPVWNILEQRGEFELLLANPQHIQNVPGRKTDQKDSEWIADLLQHGLLRGSFVPPLAIRQLRDLTRMRANLRQDHAALANRIQKILQDANIKLASVASDVFGVSGRKMLKALLMGQEKPEELAQLALGKLREKREDLELALEGQLTDHHRFQMRHLLELFDFVEGKIGTVEGEIRRLLGRLEEPGPGQTPSTRGAGDEGCGSSTGVVSRLEAAVNLWKMIPGVNEITASILAAEIGVNMDQFASAGHLASWAGLCPGNRESAGKRLSGKTRKGNVWLRRALCQAAWAASRTKNTYLSALYRRFVVRKGSKKAIVAVAHTILVSAYHMLKKQCGYEELGADYFDRLDKNALERRLVKRLISLGNEVTLRPIAAEACTS